MLGMIDVQLINNEIWIIATTIDNKDFPYVIRLSRISSERWQCIGSSINLQFVNFMIDKKDIPLAKLMADKHGHQCLSNCVLIQMDEQDDL